MCREREHVRRANRNLESCRDARDLQARDEAKPAPFDFFCAEENETCECAHGDVVYAARDEEDESKLDLMTVIISKPHVFVTGTDDFVCGNDAAGSDPAVGSTKGCWCAPKGLAEASRGGSRADAADNDEYDDDETSTAATATNYDSAASDDEDSAAADNDTASAADDTATTADYDDDDASAAAYNDTSSLDDAAPRRATPFVRVLRGRRVGLAARFRGTLLRGEPGAQRDVHEVLCRGGYHGSTVLRALLGGFEPLHAGLRSENQCCNNDLKQGSNQRLSCLQSCAVRIAFLTADECKSECAVKKCHREIHGVSLPSCSVCDDVPAHESHFGDAFKPAGYECAARWGTDQNACETGCRVGSELLDKYGHDYDYEEDEAGDEADSSPSPESPQTPPTPDLPAPPASPASPPSPHPPPRPPRPPHPFPPGDHPAFASKADLQAAVASCLSVGDGSGKEAAPSTARTAARRGTRTCRFGTSAASPT